MMFKKQDGFAGQRSYIMPMGLLESTQSHPLCQDLFITDIGYYPRASFHNRERLKGCAQNILIYCEQGEGWYSLNGKKYIVKPNHFFILPADVYHAYGADVQNPWSIYWMHFVGSLAHNYVDYLYKDFVPYEPMFISPDRNRDLLFNNIISHIEIAFSIDDVVYANTGFRHYLTTFKNAIYQPTNFAKTQSDPVSIAIAYMKEHISETLTLEKIASIAGTSPSYFSVLFRQKTQSSPIHFFTFLKIQHACYLLESSQYRIKEIAHQLGYTDPFHFSRVFTSIMGKPPKEFRKKLE